MPAQKTQETTATGQEIIIPKFGFENKTFHNVRILEFVDGDTVKCVIDVEGGIFGRKVWVSVRLVEIDAPEMKGETNLEKICAELSLLHFCEKIFEITISNDGFCNSNTSFVREYLAELKAIYSASSLEDLIFHIQNENATTTTTNNDDNDNEKIKDKIIDLNKRFKGIVNCFLKSSKCKENLTLKTFGTDLYGRVLGKLFYESSCINGYLCEEGVVRYFKGTKAREKWMKKELEEILINIYVKTFTT